MLRELHTAQSRSNNWGCYGGNIDTAFMDIKEKGGIDNERSYPYEANDGKCRYSEANKGGSAKGFMDVNNTEDDLKLAVASVGPIATSIDATLLTFEFYNGGIYIDKDCNSIFMDHSVLVVGYGTENGQDYWLVKNSYGPEWGEQGYIRMARNLNNQCGIAALASFPLV